MAYSAFDDRSKPPPDSELAEVLGDSQDLWTDLILRLEEQFQPLSVDWTFSGKKWGWSLRLKRKKRAVLYMTPRSGHFVVGFALGQKAVDAAHQSDLPQSTLDMIDGSQVYAEGRAVSFEVRTHDDIKTAVRIAAIKMDN
ncbi:MAG: DUF3788 domain-containing protein [Gemmatimonadota bacterium]|jgi:hypothetical protein